MYENAQGTKRDLKMAHDWYVKSAEAGHPDGFETELWFGTAARPYMPSPDAVEEPSTVAIHVQPDEVATP